MRLSLLEECRGRARQALGAIGTASTQDPREPMRLHAALGASTPEASEMVAAFTKALDMARRLGDCEYQLRALRGLYFYHATSGRFRTALPFAQRFHDLAMSQPDLNDRLFGERVMGLAEHMIGDQTSARSHLERVLAQDAVSDPGRDFTRFQDVVRFGSDLRFSVRIFLARVLWLQGFADQAVRMAEKTLGEAEATGHAISRCYVLALAACPIDFWVGDQVAAARYTAMLVDLSRQHALPHWASFGARFERVCVIKAGGLDNGSRRRSGSRDDAVDPNFSFRFLTGLMPLAEVLGQVGRVAEGLAVLEAGIEQFETSCFTPELLRLRGELSLLQGMPGAAGSAETHFRQALDRAREHGSLSWELRAATSLARLLRDEGRSADAIACLQAIYDRFTEGFSTADLIAAKRLLDDLNDARGG